MRWTTVCIAALCLIASSVAWAGHGGPECLSCHRPPTAAWRPAIDGCLVCHRQHGGIFGHAMATRSGEKAFVQRSYARFDSGFWEKNCTGCHIRSCRDCHGSGDDVHRPTVADCQVCHKGYYTGWDYSGRAPREENMRYQRGISVNGETFLKMLPDVHHEKGMTCADCHSMASLARGEKSSRGCRDCHAPGKGPVEHRIAAHMERMECYACHSAWGAQEYGTFFLRFRDPAMKEDFDLKPQSSSEYLRSAWLKSQDAPPLGRNAKGMVSPIRPFFTAYYTDIMSARNGGPDNIRLASEWRAWFPHTVRRGSVTCDACHDAPRRFLLERDHERILLPARDGLGRDSFWRQEGQRVVNGSFMSGQEFQRINNRSRAYTGAYLEKWKNILNRVDASSGR